MHTNSTFPYTATVQENTGLQKEHSLVSLVTIRKGISFLKDGLTGAMEKTEDCITQLVLPVNNFLKDMREIEHEFKKVQEAETEFRLCLNGRLVAANEVLQMKMEENY